MIKFLIATHGYLADGFKSTIEVIMGKEIANHIHTMNLFVDEEANNTNPQSIIKAFFDSIMETDQVIVCTDMMYGSVNQFMIPYANDTSIFLITGINLSLLCEIVSKYDQSIECVSLNELQQIVDSAKSETILVNAYMKQKESNITDDNAFFE